MDINPKTKIIRDLREDYEWRYVQEEVERIINTYLLLIYSEQHARMVCRAYNVRIIRDQWYVCSCNV